jgi:hypothetical protein
MVVLILFHVGLKIMLRLIHFVVQDTKKWQIHYLNYSKPLKVSR